jgi:hypothetical protein
MDFEGLRGETALDSEGKRRKNLLKSHENAYTSIKRTDPPRRDDSEGLRSHDESTGPLDTIRSYYTNKYLMFCAKIERIEVVQPNHIIASHSSMNPMYPKTNIVRVVHITPTQSLVFILDLSKGLVDLFFAILNRVPAERP